MSDFYTQLGQWLGGQASGGQEINIDVDQTQEMVSIPTTNINMDALAEVALISEIAAEQRFLQTQAMFKKFYSIAFVIAAGFLIKHFWGKI